MRRRDTFRIAHHSLEVVRWTSTRATTASAGDSVAARNFSQTATVKQNDAVAGFAAPTWSNIPQYMLEVYEWAYVRPSWVEVSAPHIAAEAFAGDQWSPA